jgi:hypothetical protein
VWCMVACMIYKVLSAVDWYFLGRRTVNCRGCNVKRTCINGATCSTDRGRWMRVHLGYSTETD